MFEILHAAWGPQHWWPAESAWEVIVGAFLTQNTSWTNVEKAMANLRAADALSIDAIRKLDLARLEELVRPAGYFRQKAQRLKTFVAWLDQNCEGSLERLFAAPTDQLRIELLLLNGIGPETADSILLYGGLHESFVVDTYTRRIFERHGLISSATKYEEIREIVQISLKNDEFQHAKNGLYEQALFTTRDQLEIHQPSAMSTRPRSETAQRYSEFHALIVQVGKHHCLKVAPKCEGCPLQPFLPR